ncbi:MAG: ABC transporter ATP-binding protein [Actinobacteria bacterium]|nr:ABC transporter ATP-binding protein [Actinomycetota bacterium]
MKSTPGTASTREDVAVPAPPLVDVDGLVVVLGPGRSARTVLDGVDLTIGRGGAHGLVGESGSGKSTLAKALVGVHRPRAGQIRLGGTPLPRRGLRGRRPVGLPRVQLVPQDPWSSLDPRRTVAETIAEAVDPVRARVVPARTRITTLLEQVRLDPDAADRYPHQFSGGQRQRIAIARALAADPDLLVADEITSALDLTTQAEILVLLADLRARLGLTMLFISHDLAVVREISDEVTVLLHGRVVEHGPTEDVFARPSADYTRRLLAADPGAPGFTLDETG